MYITKMFLRDFGKFHNQLIQLRPGLNLIYGANEAGKSTIQDFIVGMLFGIHKSRGLGARMDAYELRKPYQETGYSGKMQVYAKGNAYQIDRNFLRSEKKTVVTQLSNGKEVPLKKPHSLEGVIFDVHKEAYCNTLCISSNGARTEAGLTDLIQDAFVNYSTTKSFHLNRTKALEKLRAQEKQLSTKNIDAQIKQLADTLYGQDEIEVELQKIALEYERLQQEQENAVGQMESAARQANAGALRQSGSRMEVKKPSRWLSACKTLALLAIEVAAILMVCSLVLPVNWDMKWSLAIAALVIVLVGVIAAVVWKVGNQKQRSGQLVSVEEAEEIESEHKIEEPLSENKRWQRYTERLANLRVREEQLLHQRQLKNQQWEQYDALKRQREEMITEQKAIRLAMDTINQLSGSIYDGFGGQLNRKVSAIMSQITQGKYSKVYVDENLNIKVLDGEQFVSMEYLSTGTKEQLYFALRMVAADMLKTTAMPVILDDVFVAYDEERLYHTLEYLANYKENQILLFTSDSRIADYFDEIGRDYNYVRLD